VIKACMMTQDPESDRVAAIPTVGAATCFCLLALSCCFEQHRAGALTQCHAVLLEIINPFSTRIRITALSVMELICTTPTPKMCTA
jgi:hypothetical protein